MSEHVTISYAPMLDDVFSIADRIYVNWHQATGSRTRAEVETVQYLRDTIKDIYRNQHKYSDLGECMSRIASKIDEIEGRNINRIIALETERLSLREALEIAEEKHRADKHMSEKDDQ